MISSFNCVSVSAAGILLLLLLLCTPANTMADNQPPRQQPWEAFSPEELAQIGRAAGFSPEMTCPDHWMAEREGPFIVVAANYANPTVVTGRYPDGSPAFVSYAAHRRLRNSQSVVLDHNLEVVRRWVPYMHKVGVPADFLDDYNAWADRGSLGNPNVPPFVDAAGVPVPPLHQLFRNNMVCEIFPKFDTLTVGVWRHDGQNYLSTRSRINAAGVRLESSNTSAEARQLAEIWGSMCGMPGLHQFFDMNEPTGWRIMHVFLLLTSVSASANLIHTGNRFLYVGPVDIDGNSIRLSDPRNFLYHSMGNCIHSVPRGLPHPGNLVSDVCGRDPAVCERDVRRMLDADMNPDEYRRPPASEPTPEEIYHPFPPPAEAVYPFLARPGEPGGVSAVEAATRGLSGVPPPGCEPQTPVIWRVPVLTRHQAADLMINGFCSRNTRRGDLPFAPAPIAPGLEADPLFSFQEAIIIRTIGHDGFTSWYSFSPPAVSVRIATSGMQTNVELLSSRILAQATAEATDRAGFIQSAARKRRAESDNAPPDYADMVTSTFAYARSIATSTQIGRKRIYNTKDVSALPYISIYPDPPEWVWALLDPASREALRREFYTDTMHEPNDGLRHPVNVAPSQEFIHRCRAIYQTMVRKMPTVSCANQTMFLYYGAMLRVAYASSVFGKTSRRARIVQAMLDMPQHFARAVALLQMSAVVLQPTFNVNTVNPPDWFAAACRERANPPRWPPVYRRLLSLVTSVIGQHRIGNPQELPSDDCYGFSTKLYDTLMTAIRTHCPEALRCINIETLIERIGIVDVVCPQRTAAAAIAEALHLEPLRASPDILSDPAILAVHQPDAPSPSIMTQSGLDGQQASPTQASPESSGSTRSERLPTPLSNLITPNPWGLTTCETNTGIDIARASTLSNRPPSSPPARQHSSTVRSQSPPARQHSTTVRPPSPPGRQYSIMVRPPSPPVNEFAAMNLDGSVPPHRSPAPSREPSPAASSYGCVYMGADITDTSSREPSEAAAAPANQSNSEPPHATAASTPQHAPTHVLSEADWPPLRGGTVRPGRRVVRATTAVNPPSPDKRLVAAQLNPPTTTGWPTAPRYPPIVAQGLSIGNSAPNAKRPCQRD